MLPSHLLFSRRSLWVTSCRNAQLFSKNTVTTTESPFNQDSPFTQPRDQSVLCIFARAKWASSASAVCVQAVVSPVRAFLPFLVIGLLAWMHTVPSQQILRLRMFGTNTLSRPSPTFWIHRELWHTCISVHSYWNAMIQAVEISRTEISNDFEPLT